MTWPTGLKQTPEHAAALSSKRSNRTGEILPWAPACKEDDPPEEEYAKRSLLPQSLLLDAGGM